MFTKCPECNISFRVTAKVLQQANGNVRCGSCGHAFSALAYLSEEPPAIDDQAKESDERDELAETSRRLLKTLDELAGPEEVRIEDTGIEWRVVDDDESHATDAEKNVTEEMRYDDSTLLPDDFGKEVDNTFTQPEPNRRETDRADQRPAEIDAAQRDLLLSEPEDWTDILEEVEDTDSDAESLAVEEELAAIHNQLSAREDSESQNDIPADIDSQFDTQAEAMGLDISTSEEALTDQFPMLDSDAIDDFAGSDEDSGADDDDEILLEDDDFSDVAANDASDDDAENQQDQENERDRDDDRQNTEFESTGEFESQIDVAARALAGNDEDDQLTDDDAEIAADATEDNDSDDDADLALDEGASEDEDSAEIEHVVPPQTEQEMTVNMEIDQEMMALATQDDDFSATLFGVENPEELFNENSADVETIVMEGEIIRGSIEKERQSAEHDAKNQLDDPGSLVDTYALRRGKVRGGRRRHDPASYGATAAVVILALVLGGQLIHNSRESLVTIGLFNQTIAPMYRMLGNPVTPAWDIKGWQFVATNGSVDETESALTIVSRIANRAEQPLPYPLVHVSLTDRWEEIMGSRILEPGEYLAGDLDPSSPVLPGENFTAVITIENPSAEATGFKLNVCYRVSSGTVRCAIEDFKN